MLKIYFHSIIYTEERKLYLTYLVGLHPFAMAALRRMRETPIMLAWLKQWLAVLTTTAYFISFLLPTLDDERLYYKLREGFHERSLFRHESKIDR